MCDEVKRERAEGVSASESLLKVVCAVIECGSKILAARRGPSQSHAGLWEFPGGKLNGGESALQALIREIREELGVEIVPQTALTPVIYEYPSITIELIPFISQIISGEPFPHEHSEIIWIEPRDALNLEWVSADIPVFKEYLQYLPV
ncbi:MAG: (deoxy)nucleoside triphosphate pyrophosphohydrolase [Chitinispirillales bacterium]|jgi:8-oxo-dGTP diphosphatase|nr:(deoxy)nucleoside triphosphate pyrophosphohydrolase [Chitinispirillales bacterium]